MPGKKHSIRVVLVILGSTLVFLTLVMVVVLTSFGPSVKLSFSDKVGVIPIEGPITAAEPVVSQLVKYKEDQKIRAIILRIDSPGGGVGPAQEIYREIRKTIETKTVVASMGGVAASGGYYIAAGADRIVANPGTITGSIAVIMEFIQLEDLLKRIGVGLEVLKSGEFKDVGSPHRKMSEREREMIHRLISDIQDQFVDAVAKGRDLPAEKVREIADGRVFSGAQAKELGLVDMLGNFRDAVDLAKTLTGIEGEVTLVYPRRPRSGLWDWVFDDAGSALARAFLKRLEHRGLEYKWVRFSSPAD